jgi:hypothetical protein
MISILWKIFIALHGNLYTFKGLVCGEIRFEISSSEGSMKYNKTKIISNLKGATYILCEVRTEYMYKI